MNAAWLLNHKLSMYLTLSQNENGLHIANAISYVDKVSS